MKEIEEYMMLSAQCALLGAVSPELRAVSISIDQKTMFFSVSFFYDGVIDDNLFDLASVAVTEMCSDLDHDYELDETIERLDYPSPLPNEGRIVYRRYEPKETIDEPFVLLSAQRALLVRVTPQLRVVIFELSNQEKNLKVVFFYDGEISEESKDLAERALLKIQADLPKAYHLEHELRRLDYPARVPLSGRVVYRRYEKVDEVSS